MTPPWIRWAEHKHYVIFFFPWLGQKDTPDTCLLLHWLNPRYAWRIDPSKQNGLSLCPVSVISSVESPYNETVNDAPLGPPTPGTFSHFLFIFLNEACCLFASSCGHHAFNHHWWKTASLRATVSGRCLETIECPAPEFLCQARLGWEKRRRSQRSAYDQGSRRGGGGARQWCDGKYTVYKSREEWNQVFD